MIKWLVTGKVTGSTLVVVIVHYVCLFQSLQCSSLLQQSSVLVLQPGILVSRDILPSGVKTDRSQAC